MPAAERGGTRTGSRSKAPAGQPKRPAGTGKAALERAVLLAGAAPQALDLAEFAARVKWAAASAPTGRFGGNKVFISHAWRHLQGDAAVRALSAR